jgi:dipeptidyl aminopeptidase/acylaminoacyl peptidase
MPVPEPFELQHLLAAAVPSDPTVRADGGAVAFVLTAAHPTDDRWVRTVTVVGADGTAASSDGPDDRHPRWAPAGDTLAFIRPDHHGSDIVVAWPDGRPLSRPANAVRSFAWSPDGARLAVVTNIPADTAVDGPIVIDRPAYKRDGAGWQPAGAELVVTDVDTGVARSLLGPCRTIGDVAWTTDGTAMVVALPHDDTSWRWDLHRVDVATGSTTLLTDHGDWDRAACPIPLDGGDVLYVGGEAGPTPAELRRISLGRVAPHLDRNVTIGVPAYPGAPPVRRGDQVLFTANDAAVSRLCRVPLAGGDTEWLTPPDAVVHGLATAGDRVVVTESTADCPGRVRDLDGVTQWAAPAAALPWRVEELDVVASDGRRVPCVLLRSVHAGEAPAATLLDLHGGPHNVSNAVLATGNLHRWQLARQGWHVLLPNVRGSDGYGETWYRGLEEGGGWASTDVGDALAVADAAVARGLADPARLAVHGYSYGGLLVAALTSTTDRFAAAAMGGAPVDLLAFASSADLPVALWHREVGGLPWADAHVGRRSPIHRVGDVRTPTLIIHGTADQRVPVAQAEQWFQGLQAHGVPSQLVLHRGAPHGFVTAGSPRTVAAVGERIADWLVRWTPTGS